MCDGYVTDMRGIRSIPLMLSIHLYIGIPKHSCPKNEGDTTFSVNYLVGK